MIIRTLPFTPRHSFYGQMVIQPTHHTVQSVQLNKPADRNRIEVGDLVVRKYEIKIPNFVKVGLVIERDRNGFLSIFWGGKIECMWDDYDLMRLE